MTRTAQRTAFAVTLRLSGEDGAYQRNLSTEGDPEPGVILYERTDLRAVRGSTAFREGSNRQNGVRIVRSVDWLCDPQAFRSAVGRWPEDGDTFMVTPPRHLDGVAATTYRVSPINGEPCYRLDPTGSVLRIHTHEANEIAD